jgi:hypothetical protein
MGDDTVDQQARHIQHVEQGDPPAHFGPLADVLPEIRRQLWTVKQLADLSIQQCRVDAGAMDERSDEVCSHDSDHGRATVFIFTPGHGREGDWLCPSCSFPVVIARTEHDAHVDVEVYR